MPTYEYMTDAGEIVEIVKPMKDSDPIGSIVEITYNHQQIQATRIPSDYRVQGDNWRPYVSNRLPRGLHNCPCTPDGKPIVTSKQQERNIRARFGYDRQ